MGVTKVSQSFKTKVTPSRMFKALIMDSHNLCPQLMFSSIKSIDFLEGNGEVGTIKQLNLTDASPFKYVKHRIDALDEENFSCKYTLIEVDALKDKIDHVTYDVKFEPYGYGGCICRITSEYYTKDDVEIKEEDIEQGKDRAIGMYEVVEAYLLAHPRAYSSPFKYVKHRIDALDEENFSCKYTLIEVDALKDKIDHVTYDVKFEPYGNGGCICRITSEYYTKDDVEIKEEDIEQGKKN